MRVRHRGWWRTIACQPSGLRGPHENLTPTGEDCTSPCTRARVTVSVPGETRLHVIGILLAEDHYVVRAALVALLELEPDMRIVAEVGRGDEVLAAAKRTQPNVAVVDIDLPGIDGLSAAAQVHAEVSQCRTLVLTALGGPARCIGRWSRE